MDVDENIVLNNEYQFLKYINKLMNESKWFSIIEQSLKNMTQILGVIDEALKSKIQKLIESLRSLLPSLICIHYSITYGYYIMDRDFYNSFPLNNAEPSEDFVINFYSDNNWTKNVKLFKKRGNFECLRGRKKVFNSCV